METKWWDFLLLWPANSANVLGGALLLQFEYFVRFSLELSGLISLPYLYFLSVDLRMPSMYSFSRPSTSLDWMTLWTPTKAFLRVSNEEE